MRSRITRLIFGKKNFNFKAEYMKSSAMGKGPLHLRDIRIAGYSVYIASTVTLCARGVKATIKADLIRLSTFSRIQRTTHFLFSVASSLEMHAIILYTRLIGNPPGRRNETLRIYSGFTL